MKVVALALCVGPLDHSDRALKLQVPLMKRKRGAGEVWNSAS